MSEKLGIKVTIKPIFEDNFLFFIHNDSSCWVVDPGEATTVEYFLRERSLKLEGILVTHEHDDHIGGVERLLKNHPGIQVIGGPQNVKKFYSQIVSPNDPFSLLSSEVEVLNLQGHTSEQIGFYFRKQEWLFSGDALFHLGCGRIFKGTYEESFSSLQRISKLPDHTSIFCSHDYTFANSLFFQSLHPEKNLNEYENAKKIPLLLGIEKEWNPFLKSKDLAEFTDLRKKRNLF